MDIWLGKFFTWTATRCHTHTRAIPAATPIPCVVMLRLECIQLSPSLKTRSDHQLCVNVFMNLSSGFTKYAKLFCIFAFLDFSLIYSWFILFYLSTCVHRSVCLNLKSYILCQKPWNVCAVHRLIK